jgi:hypothetical protein
MSAGSDATVVTTLDEARAAMGTTVQLTGTLLHTKLAPTVDLAEFSAYCVGLDPDPALFDTVVSVRGTFSWTERYAATVSKSGEISQGTAGGSWVLDDCTLVTP